MPFYSYRVLQSNGTVAEGTLQANNRQDAYRQLEQRNLKPIQLVENTKSDSPKKTFSLDFNTKKVSYRELENFTRMLSSLLAAGVPLSRALTLLSNEASSPTAKEKWKTVHDRVIDGMTLADAMSLLPETFPRVYVAMVQAGETGGFLDLVLAQIADFQEREKELRTKVFSALIYPMVLMGLAVAVLIFLMVFFIPRFQLIFAGFGASLPLLTQIIVGASHFISRYGIFIAFGIGGLVYLVRTWLQSDNGKRLWEQWLLQIPVIGSLVARFAMARFSRMLGTLLGAGVPLISALNVARKSIGNQTLVDAVNVSIERVKQGDRLCVSLSDCKTLFPNSVLEMISVAEESGRLDKEMIRLATVTESDLDRQLKTAVSLAEPLMLFLIAGFIGTIFVGMVIPIFTIQDYIK